MNEVKFAILIGIDDEYDSSKLKYCKKDVLDFKTSLINYCNYQDENIFDMSLTSSSGSDLEIEINNIFLEIKKKFKTNSDSLLFYYSGHGEGSDDGEKSYLCFPIKNYDTSNIRDRILDLKPKRGYIILDACFSASPLFSKGKTLITNEKKWRRKLLNDSSAIIGIYSTLSTDFAYQDFDIKNSVFTYYFLEAISNEANYDSDGTLSIDKIYDYAAKKTYRHVLDVSITQKRKINIQQVPVKEGRIEGYNEFAFLNKTILPENIKAGVSNSINPVFKSNLLFNILDLVYFGLNLRDYIQLIFGEIGFGMEDPIQIEIITDRIKLSAKKLLSEDSVLIFAKKLDEIKLLSLKVIDNEKENKIRWEKVDSNITYAIHFVLDYENHISDSVELIIFNLSKILSHMNSLHNSSTTNADFYDKYFKDFENLISKLTKDNSKLTIIKSYFQEFKEDKSVSVVNIPGKIYMIIREIIRDIELSKL